MKGDCNICINGKMPSYSATCVECGLSRKNYKPFTNYDLLREKSVEEMADWLVMNGDGSDYKTWLDWLKQEVSTNG